GDRRPFPGRIPGRHRHRLAPRRQPRLPGRRTDPGGATGPRPRRPAAARAGGRRMSRHGNPWLLPVSVLVALLLGLLPLPDVLQPVRPYWLALVLVYWWIEEPDRAGLGLAFVCGVCADLVFGSVLGEQALRLVIMAFIVGRFRAQL